MVEVDSYLHLGCGCKVPTWRGKDKEPGKVHPLEFGATDVLPYVSNFQQMLLDLRAANASLVTTLCTINLTLDNTWSPPSKSRLYSGRGVLKKEVF